MSTLRWTVRPSTTAVVTRSGAGSARAAAPRTGRTRLSLGQECEPEQREAGRHAGAGARMRGAGVVGATGAWRPLYQAVVE